MILSSTYRWISKRQAQGSESYISFSGDDWIHKSINSESLKYHSSSNWSIQFGIEFFLKKSVRTELK